LFFFQVEVKGEFFRRNLNSAKVVGLYPGLLFVGILVERDLVLARRDAE